MYANNKDTIYAIIVFKNRVYKNTFKYQTTFCERKKRLENYITLCRHKFGTHCVTCHV